MEEENKNIPVVDNTVVEDNVPVEENIPASDPAPESEPKSPLSDEPVIASAAPEPTPEEPAGKTPDSKKFQFLSSDLKVSDSSVLPKKEKSGSKFLTILFAVLAVFGLAFGALEYYVNEVDPASPLANLLPGGTAKTSDTSVDDGPSDLEIENSKLRSNISLLENLTRATIVEDVYDPDLEGNVTVAKYLADLAPATSLKSPEFGLAIDLSVDPASLETVYTESPAGEKPNALSGTLEIKDIATLYRYYVEPNPEYAFDYAGTCDVIIGEVGHVFLTYNYCVKFADGLSEPLKSALSNPENYYQL